MKPKQLSISFIKALKQQILASRYAVAKIANAEMLRLYYSLGKAVEEEFSKNKWGAKVVDDISRGLQQELPGLRGFSGKNIAKMRYFYKAWQTETLICSSLTSKIQNEQDATFSSLTSKLKEDTRVTQLQLPVKTENPDINAFLSVSFTHHYEIILKTDAEAERWYYIIKTAQNFWSVRHLRTELKNKSHLHEKSLPNNFEQTMPDKLSNKAIRAFKDQYLLDFVKVEDANDDLDERVLENEIVQNIRKFLMSLGPDFSFMGNQFRLIVEEDEYFVDLLFYHRRLQALVAFDLKKGKFKPEYVGKMNFYLSALDDMVKLPHENASIGIILCKEKNNKKVEYSFRDFSKPMGVATYRTSETLPPELKDALPDAETLKGLME
jgi:predicted nuclease of restriction endonuclease-like (RecB) superfamily